MSTCECGSVCLCVCARLCVKGRELLKLFHGSVIPSCFFIAFYSFLSSLLKFTYYE
jgi:hypothetical protein